MTARRTETPPLRNLIEAVLEGVPLPARRSDLVHHAEHEGEHGVAAALRSLPGRRYSSIDEVGEAFEPVQPRWPHSPPATGVQSHLPPGEGESGRP